MTSVVDSCEIRMLDRELVARVRASAPTADAIAAVADVFALLGDVGRLRILTALLNADELCVCDIAAASEMSESATSHALRLLRVQAVLKVRRAGRMAYYSLSDDHVRTLLAVALTHVAHGAADG